MPHTRVFVVSAESPESSILDDAASVLAKGGLVAFPTETVYGLGADATNAKAVGSVFAAKGRPADNPLIVHLADASDMSSVAAEIPSVAETLAQAFWPGPLTLVLKSRSHVPREVTAGLATVAVRVPDHNVPRELVRRLGRGIVGPSANSSGRPSPTCGEHVLSDLRGKIDMILDSGPTRIGMESTVLDLSGVRPAILRYGGLTQESIESVIGPISSTAGPDSLRRSPGTRHRHYAPSAKVILIPLGDQEGAVRTVEENKAAGKRVGVIIHSVTIDNADADLVIRLESDPSRYAHRFYAVLRDMDSAGMDAVVVEEIGGPGLGRTLSDRMRRAAE